MARVEPFRALLYDRAVAGPLQDLAAPPYDAIDAAQRAELLEGSPHNVVAVDLSEPGDGSDPYEHAAALLAQWRREGILVRDGEPAMWALVQDHTAPDGRRVVRHGILARVRIEDPATGRIRAHERTSAPAHPAEDRLQLTRAAQVNLSPVLGLYPDPELTAWNAVAPVCEQIPFGQVTEGDGTVHRLWRVGDPDAIATVQAVLEDAGLLVADGHHSYEAACAYAEEVGGEGPHRCVLMCLVALEDEGLTVLPTHRLVDGLAGDEPRQVALAEALAEHFALSRVAVEDLVPPDDAPGLQLGYLHFGAAFRLRLRDRGTAGAALPEASEALRTLDTAVLEALVLKGPLGLSDDDIAHRRGLAYARSAEEGTAAVLAGEHDVGFFLRGVPIEQVRAIARAGETMPPKSAAFFPKVWSGLLFNPLTDPE